MLCCYIKPVQSIHIQTYFAKGKLCREEAFHILFQDTLIFFFPPLQKSNLSKVFSVCVATNFFYSPFDLIHALVLPKIT